MTGAKTTPALSRRWLLVLAYCVGLALLPVITLRHVVLAASPRLTVSREVVEPGSALAVSGSRFPGRTKGALIWSATGAVLATFRTGATGAFSVEFAVPDAPTGGHAVIARVNGSSASVPLAVRPTANASGATRPAHVAVAPRVARSSARARVIRLGALALAP